MTVVGQVCGYQNETTILADYFQATFTGPTPGANAKVARLSLMSLQQLVNFATIYTFNYMPYSYVCIHCPWLDEHGQAIKVHVRAWIELKITTSDQLCPRPNWSKAAQPHAPF